MAQRHSVRRAAPCGIRWRRTRYRGRDVCLCQRACRSPAYRHASGQPAHAGCELKAGFKRAGIVYVSEARRVSRSIGCVRRKSRASRQQFTRTTNGPNGANLVDCGAWGVCRVVDNAAPTRLFLGQLASTMTALGRALVHLFQAIGADGRRHGFLSGGAGQLIANLLRLVKRLDDGKDDGSDN